LYGNQACREPSPSWPDLTDMGYSISVAEVIALQDVAWQVIAASSGLRRALRRRLRSDDVSGLSDAQRELVRTVGRNPGIRVGEAALELHLAANTVSTLVTSLVAEGWMRRDTDPLDARSARLSLTPGAERRIEERRDRRLAIVTEAMGSLSADDQRRIAAALPALDRLVEQVKAD
jgi:DNA-binding MarR family transcriptional regulator